MTHNKDHSNEFDQLLGDAINGKLTGEQFVRLNHVLSTDSEARARFLDQVHVHSLLTFGNFQFANREGRFESREAFAKYVAEVSKRTDWEKEIVREFRVTSSLFQQGEVGNAGENQRPEPDRTKTALFGLQTPSWMTSHAAALVLFSIAALVIGAFGARHLLVPAGSENENYVVVHRTPAEQPVAYLASVTGCDWGTGEYQSQTVGSAIPPDQQISLHEGIAEFRLASGVSISIEGPASLSIASQSSLHLDYGKLTVHVPWTVTDFAVSSEVCFITACEAEFGMSLYQESKDIAVDAHAFSGKILVMPGIPRSAKDWEGSIGDEESLAEGDSFARASVAQGRSLTVRSDGEGCKVSRWSRADETMFATKLPMAWPLPITRDYVDAVTESNPLGYWRFESQDNARVKNECSEGSDLRIVGNLRLTGDSLNNVADFNRLGSDCYLLSARPLDLLSNKDEYSIELWFKSSHVQWGGVASLITVPATPLEGHAFYLELQGTPNDVRSPVSPAHFVKHYPGSVRFLHRNPPTDINREFGASCFSDKGYAIRRWQHLVAVKNANEIRLYLNGELSGSLKDFSRVASDSLYLLVGRRSSPERASQFSFATMALTFVGQLDEIAVYGKALSEREIQKHFNAVHWDANSSPGGPWKARRTPDQVRVDFNASI